MLMTIWIRQTTAIEKFVNVEQRAAISFFRVAHPRQKARELFRVELINLCDLRKGLRAVLWCEIS